MNPDHSAPMEAWIHSVCNIGFQSVQADKRAEDKSHDWPEKGFSKEFKCLTI